MKKALLVIALLSSGCITPANQPNSHELCARETVYDGNTTTTREVWVGVPRVFGEPSSRMKVRFPSGFMVDAQTSATKKTIGGLGLSAIGAAGGFITGKGGI